MSDFSPRLSCYVVKISAFRYRVFFVLHDIFVKNFKPYLRYSCNRFGFDILELAYGTEELANNSSLQRTSNYNTSK